jgi:hypothetical protein
MFVFELDDVFVHRLDFVRIFAQPNHSRGLALDRNRVADFKP